MYRDELKAFGQEKIVNIKIKKIQKKKIYVNNKRVKGWQNVDMLNVEYKQVIQKNKIEDYDLRLGFKNRNKCLHLQKFIKEKQGRPVGYIMKGKDELNSGPLKIDKSILSQREAFEPGNF